MRMGQLLGKSYCGLKRLQERIAMQESKDRYYLLDLLGGVFVIVVPMITAVVAIYQKMPWSMPMRHLLSVLTILSGSVAIVLKVRSVNSAKNDHNELKRAFERSRVQVDECNRLMKLLVTERRQNLALLTDADEDFTRRFVSEVAQSTAKHGFCYMEYLNYEYALVFKWWQDDSRGLLMSVMRITKEELKQMEIVLNGDEVRAVQKWLFGDVPISASKCGDEFTSGWNDNIRVAYDNIMPVAVEGYGFSPKVYLHSDNRSMELYHCQLLAINGKNIGVVDNDGRRVSSFTIDTNDLRSIVGVGRFAMSQTVTKLLGSAGFAPILT